MWRLSVSCQDGHSGGAQTVASVVTGSSSASSGSSANTGVNKAIQALAHRYCVECKGTFDELSKITQVCNWETPSCDRLKKKLTVFRAPSFSSRFVVFSLANFAMFAIIVSAQFGHCRLNPCNFLKFCWPQIVVASIFNSGHVQSTLTML